MTELCHICSRKLKYQFTHKVLNKYDVDYFMCENCGFVQTEEPYWLKEAYQESINISDTGIMSRNIYLSKVTAILIYFLFEKNAKFLDFAGGYGIFTRLMRDIGFDFYWHDPFTPNLVARGFEYNKSIKDIELITSFESFEHFVHPLKEIEKMLKISKNILFSTELLPNPIPKPNEWWYYGLEHGQHISFYSLKTLKFTAKKYDLNFYSMGVVHLLTFKKFSSIMLKILAKLNRLGLFTFVKGKIKSKTFEDMQKISISLGQRVK